MTHEYSGLGPVLLWTAPMFDLGLNFDLNYTPVKFVTASSMFLTLLHWQHLPTNRLRDIMHALRATYLIGPSTYAHFAIMTHTRTHSHTHIHTNSKGKKKKSTNCQEIVVWQSRMCWVFSLFIAHSALHFTNHVVFDENKSVNLLFLALIQLIDGDLMIALPNVEKKVSKSVQKHMYLWYLYIEPPMYITNRT